MRTGEGEDGRVRRRMWKEGRRKEEVGRGAFSGVSKCVGLLISGREAKEKQRAKEKKKKRRGRARRMGVRECTNKRGWEQRPVQKGV